MVKRAFGIKPPRGGIKGAVDGLLASRLEAILARPGGRLYDRFAAAAADTAKTQNEVLADIVAYAKDTVFGKEHGFAEIRGPADFRKRVPIRDYEGHRPYVDRHAGGEESVLFPGKPMMYNRSSGTTSLPKLIPVTPYNFERTIKDRGKLWLYGLSRLYPGVYAGRSFSVVSPAVEGHTADGTPFGSLSGVIRENIPEFMKLTHAVPYAATLIDDYQARIYVMLRFALACDITVFLTGNPATVLNCVTRADAWKEDIIRDIRDGTIRRDLVLEPKLRAMFEAALFPAPDRAAELDRLARAHDALRPADYWPNLKLVHTWKNGNTRLVIPKIAPWFRPETPILDFGYISSEILSADLMVPENDGSILQIQSGFYEFSRLEDGDAPGRDFLSAHELEVGGRYYIYITTASGLYRYDMNDVLEVVGRFHTAPVVRFLFKGKGVTSLQGEKLSEAQLIEAVERAAAEQEICHDFFIAYADAEDSRYRLYIEPTGDYPDERIAAFGRAVDAALEAVNIEYESKRKSDRLKPLAVVRMGADFFARYRALRRAEGTQDGQIKWLQLSGTEATRRRLKQLTEE